MSSRPPGSNFWFDRDNSSKWCVEGAVTNLLCQLLSTDDAAKFKELAIANREQLITARGSGPKNVIFSNGPEIVFE